VINTFITFAENRILSDIDLDVFKLEVTANMTSGNKFLTAPSDILTHRYLIVTSGTDQIFLDFRDTSFMKEYWPNGATTGDAKVLFGVGREHFLHCADAQVLLWRWNWATSIVLRSFPRRTTTTWISTNAPEALFYACLIQAYSYTKGPPDMMATFDASYKQALQGLGIEQQGRRRRDEYRDGMVRVQLKSETPGP
jgi:hypothetical protein